MVQYEQYEQEMKHLQQLIEGAHREIEDKPVATSNIQELQAQINRHEVRQKGRQLHLVAGREVLPAPLGTCLIPAQHFGCLCILKVIQ